MSNPSQPAAGCEVFCLRPAPLLVLQMQIWHPSRRWVQGPTQGQVVPVVAGCIILPGVQVLCSTLQFLTLLPGVHNQAPYLLGLIQQLQHRLVRLQLLLWLPTSSKGDWG